MCRKGGKEERKEKEKEEGTEGREAIPVLGGHKGP